MDKLQPLHTGLGQAVLGSRPYTAPSRSYTVGRQTWILKDRVTSVRPLTSHSGRQLSLQQVKPLIQDRLLNIQSALMAADPKRTGLVEKEEFRQVLKRLLSVNQNQLNAVLNQVCERSGDMVDYTHFLRRFGQTPTALRTSSSTARRGPQNTSMSLAEIEKHLKYKIGGNLSTVIRVFRLFDYNQEGHLQQHEFRRILDNYCIRLTDKEFHRLWNHYSPSNTATISYEAFLDKLGFGDSHSFNIAPVCTKLELPSRGTAPCEKVKKENQKPESQVSLREAVSVLPHRKLQALFYNKMCMNSTPVWQALQAFDTTHSGLVKQDVLRAVLSNFIFPMNPLCFQKLTSRYGVKTSGPVRWKHFLGHFVNRVIGDSDSNVQSDRVSEQPALVEDNLDFHNIYLRLKEIFRVHGTNEGGCINRADLHYFLERPGGTQHRLSRPQITELLKVLDPGHTGVVQLNSLERLNRSITCAPTGDAAPSPPPADSSEPLDVYEDDEQKAADERQTSQRADTECVASAAQRTVESLLLDKLCEQLSSVLAALKLCDPQHSGYVSQEDLKEVLSCYGVPISDMHFKNLCGSCSRPGNSSMQVSYSDFLINLGVPLTDVTNTSSAYCSNKKTHNTDRLSTSPQPALQSVRRQRPASGLQAIPDNRNIQDIVFQRIRRALEKRHTSLSDRIDAIIQRAGEAKTLSQADVRKILEDSWVILDDTHFSKFTELLGFRNGWIERSVFQAKYEEARERLQGSEVSNLLTTAEQCLAAMKTRIKTIHGDNLTAFRFMDRKRKGVVDRHDFKALYSSLRFFCSEEEYQRLLDLIGLHPAGNLNYTEFVEIVENDGKQETQNTCVEQQLHDLLAREARFKWRDMSKVLCQFDTDSQAWIYKKNLRGLLFTYALPMTSDEFEQFWTSYDPEGRGRVAVCEFLDRLGIHHGEELRSQSRRTDRTDAQQDTDGPVSSDAASLEHIQQVVQDNYDRLSDALTHLQARDGTVRVEELLSLLHTYSCSIQREQLVNHLLRLKVSMDDSCRRLASLDFLSAFNNKEEKQCERPPASPDAVRNIESLENLNPDMALTRMRELASASASNLYKAFSAFDQRGTGAVRALDFRQVLECFCARLSDKQYRYMLTKLQLDGENRTVNWKDFLSTLQEQRPQITERAPSGSMEGRSKTSSTTQTKPSAVTHPLQQIQQVVSGHLYEITKELMDMDPSNSATISKDQFRQLCDRRWPSLTNDQFECVWSQMPVNEQRKLQYREFLKRFGALSRTPHAGLSPEPTVTKPGSTDTQQSTPQRTKSAPQCRSRRPASVGRPGTGSPAGSTERRLRATLQPCWKEIQKGCAMLDPQQEGHISTASFLEILQSFNVTMTEEQFHHLAEKVNITNNGRVSYHSFFRHFLLNLKPAESSRPFERRKLPLPTTPTSLGVLSEDGVQVMLRIYESVRSSWSAIRRCFLTSDHTRTGSVTVQDFRKVLRHFNVSLSEEEFFHLSSYLDANTTGKICYNDFLWAFVR